MADGGGHFPQRGELGGLRQRLFGDGEVLLHLLTLGDFPLEADVELAQFRRFLAEDGRLAPGAAGQKVEDQRQENGKAHDLERQHRVHLVADRGIGGEADQPPAPERDARLIADHRLAADIGVGRPRGPVRGRLQGAFQRRGGGRGRQRLGQHLAAPAGFGRQDHPALAVEDRDRIGDAAEHTFELRQFRADDDHARQLVVRQHRAGIGKVIGAGLALGRGKDGVFRPHGLDKRGPLGEA